MKKRILSSLLIFSLISGLIVTNAVSIDIENLETKNDNASIIMEELNTDEIIQEEWLQNEDNIISSKTTEISHENSIISDNLSFSNELFEETNYAINSSEDYGISTLSLSNYTVRDYIQSPMYASIGGSPAYNADSDYMKLSTLDTNGKTVETWDKQYDCGYVFGPGPNDAMRNDQYQGNCPNFIQNKYGSGDVAIMFESVYLYKGEKIQIPVQAKGCNVCNSDIQIRYWLHKDGLNVQDGNHEYLADSTNNNIFGTLYNNTYYGQTLGYEFKHQYTLKNDIVEFEIPSTGYYTLEVRISVYASQCGSIYGTFMKHGVSTGGTITILSPNRYIYYRYQNTDGSYPNYSVQTYTNTRDNKTYNQNETTEWFANSVTNTMDSFTSTKVGNGTNLNDTSNVYYIMDGGVSYIDIARKQYTVTLNKGNGIAGVTGNGTYYCGAPVTINASLSNGYNWSKWSGTHNTNTQNYTFTMPASNVIDTANANMTTYNISYILDGGTVSSVNPTTYTIETNTFILNNPTKTGYTFLGWTGSNGSTPSTNVSIPKGSTGDKNYTANWQANDYIVTLNKGKGIDTITGSGTYKYGDNVTINATLLPGYAWANWTGTHNTNTQNYMFTMPTSNVTDTANATPIAYNISYDLDGGDVTKENPVTYNVETETFTLNNPTKKGYTFLGWTGSNGTTPETEVTIPKGSTGNKNFTANWLINEYAVILNKGRGIENVSGDGIYKYGEDVTINATLLPGYAWTNWTGTHNDKTQEYSFIMSDSDVIDTANATPITYNIIYDLDGGSVTKENPVTYNVETETFALNNPAKKGYTFLGWTGSNGDTPKIEISIPTGSVGDKNYKANWKINQYTVTVNKGRGIESVTGNGSYDFGTNVTITATLKPGYEWKDWTGTHNSDKQNYTFILSDSDVTETANAEPITYNITYDLDGGNVEKENPATYNVETETFTLNNPTREGYEFIGWTENNETKPNTDVSIPKGSTGNRSYTANWKAIDYKINYNLEGGSVTGNPTSYNIETETFTLNNPTKEGYTFLGWTGDNGDTPNTNVSIEKGSIGDKSYKANWKINPYNVTVNKGRGIESVTGGGTYDFGTNITITATLKPGYKWLNWTGTHNSDKQNYEFTLPASNVTETANAEPITYNISYDLDEGSVTKENPVTYNVETKTFTLNNPIREGYTFLGWTGSNGTTPQTEVTVSKGSLEDKNYKANWKINQYLVTYIDVDSNGKELGKTTKMVDFGTFVRGSELGDNTSENAYYDKYKYISDTTAMVTTDGATVYRNFELWKTEIKDAPIKEKPNNIPTGDTSPIGILIVLLVSSFTGLFVFRKKKK